MRSFIFYNIQMIHCSAWNFKSFSWSPESIIFLGEELTSRDDPEYGHDPIWNFHIWNDVWVFKQCLGIQILFQTFKFQMKFCQNFSEYSTCKYYISLLQERSWLREMTPNLDKIPFGTFRFGTMFGWPNIVQQCLVIQILFQTFEFQMESCQNFSELGLYL